MGRTPSTAVPGDARQRLSRRDWIEEALEVIATQGLQAVAIEPIAARLGVTKGSFYAHFGAHAELVAAALERWRQVDTDNVLASLRTIDDPRQRLVGADERWEYNDDEARMRIAEHLAAALIPAQSRHSH